MFPYDYDDNSLINVNVDLPQSARPSHRRSLDYGALNFSWSGQNRARNASTSRYYSIPSSPSQVTNSPSSTPAPKNMIFIRRQSSEKYLQKRHSVDSNNSDPGYGFLNNKAFLTPSQQRSPRESSSPKSCHSSNPSVTGKYSSASSTGFLSRQSSTNSTMLPRLREPEENLQNNKWFSSSSVILTRVKSMKEKFRRVVVQSVQPDDWPPPSVLFSDRYRCPSSSSFQSSILSSGGKTHQTPIRSKSQLVKSKSIDQSSFPSTITNTKKVSKIFSPAGSGRYAKRERLQRSMTSYSDSMDQGSGNENGIVCSDMDLKAIISTFKREEASMSYGKYSSSCTTDEKGQLIQNGSKTPVGTSSVAGPGFGKRKLMRKQVSFDDEQGVMLINRKVSAIAEEIECHATFEQYISERQPSTTDANTEESNVSKNYEYSKNQNTQSEEEDENLSPNDQSLIPLLPKEIEFDEYGQTWEVYGADPDPEILGQAIQHHLERLMVCRHGVSLPNGDASRPKAIISADSKMKIEENEKSARILKTMRTDLHSSENNLRFFARRLCGKWSCFFSGHQDSDSRVTISID